MRGHPLLLQNLLVQCNRTQHLEPPLHSWPSPRPPEETLQAHDHYQFPSLPPSIMCTPASHRPSLAAPAFTSPEDVEPFLSLTCPLLLTLGSLSFLRSPCPPTRSQVHHRTEPYTSKLLNLSELHTFREAKSVHQQPVLHNLWCLPLPLKNKLSGLTIARGKETGAGREGEGE